jgi:hypothetical protein
MQTPEEVAAMLRLKALWWGVRRIGPRSPGRRQSPSRGGFPRSSAPDLWDRRSPGLRLDIGGNGIECQGAVYDARSAGVLAGEKGENERGLIPRPNVRDSAVKEYGSLPVGSCQQSV